MKKEMLINVLQPEEIRIAIIEDGVLEELYVERTSHESYVGNIYKGRIVNIEPSIQAAFVDFGVGRNGFLHVSDVEPAYYRHLEQRDNDRGRNGPRGYRDRPERSRPPERLPYAQVADEFEDAEPEYPSAPPEEIAGHLPPQEDREAAAHGLMDEAAPPTWSEEASQALDLAPPSVEPAENASSSKAAPPSQEDDESRNKKSRRGRRGGRKPRSKKTGPDEAGGDATAPESPENEPAPGQFDEDRPRPMPSSERRTEEDDSRQVIADEELSFSMAPPTSAPAQAIPQEDSHAPRGRQPSPPTHEEHPPATKLPASYTDESLGFAEPPAVADEAPPSWRETPEEEPPLGGDLNDVEKFDDEPGWGGSVRAEESLGDDGMDHEVEIRELGGDEDQRPMGRTAEEIRDERPRPERPRDDRPRDDRPREDRPRDDRPRDDRPRHDRPHDDRPRDDRPRDDRQRGRGYPSGQDGGYERDRPRGRRDDHRGGGRDDRRGGGRDDRRGPPRRMMGGRPGMGRPKPLIQDIFKRGQEVLVQVIKEGIGTKGPTLSTYISIAGRYLVLMPGLQRIGVSRKIQDDESRRRLRDIMNELQPPKGLGFIIRTAGIDRNKKELQSDLDYLSKIWHVVVRRIRKTKSPADIYQESDMVTRTIRDIFTSEIDTIWVDEPAAFEKAKEFLQGVMPRYASRIQLYDKSEPMFHKYGIEDEIARIQQRHVPLPMGGSIVIDQAEACVAIDVNSGNFRADNNAEETAYQMNLQAAKEIARQLRLRDLGGVIVNDFIDMRDEKHRRAVEKALRDAIKRDRARTKILKISQFGIIEMTRQRIRPSLKRSVYAECGHCKGTGHVKTNESMSIDVMRLVQLAAGREAISRIDIRVNQDVAHYLLNRKRGPLAQLEEQGGKQVMVRGDAHVAPEFLEFLCLDTNGNEVKFMPVEEPPSRGHRR